MMTLLVLYELLQEIERVRHITIVHIANCHSRSIMYIRKKACEYF